MVRWEEYNYLPHTKETIMTAVVTIIQKPVFDVGDTKILATYHFEDSEQALKVARTFEPVYVDFHREVITAEYKAVRDGSTVLALQIAYTVTFNGTDYDQTHWLISDSEIASSAAMSKAFEDYNSSAGYDFVAIKQGIAAGEPYYTFDPHLVEYLNRTLWA